jgi:DMSO/TMAO reductase YedYZ molybdopterin-dependent catalytic subunit
MSTRGFTGRKPPEATRERLPPGQYLTEDFPVLQIGPNPRIDLATWSFTLREGSRPLKSWSWAAISTA